MGFSSRMHSSQDLLVQARAGTAMRGVVESLALG
jgi:hypothetical protein